MVLDINVISRAVILEVFDQIKGPLVVSKKLNWQIGYVTEIEPIDPTGGLDNNFICLTNSNILSFSRRGKDSSLFFANLRN